MVLVNVLFRRDYSSEKGWVDVRSRFDNNEPQARPHGCITGTGGSQRYTTTKVERCHSQKCTDGWFANNLKHFSCWITKSNFWPILSGKPVKALLPPINQSIIIEMASRCIITSSLGANCCPNWFNNIWQIERKAEDFNMKASQESPVLPAPAFGAFSTKHNTTFNRVRRSVRICRRFLNERGNYLDLCHLLNKGQQTERLI